MSCSTTRKTSGRSGAWDGLLASGTHLRFGLIRDHKGDFYVLEDNLRVPSGVSYMLENRALTKRVFGELFEDASILPVADYPNQLFDVLSSISPRPGDYPEVVVLTPGIYNSAYFEHAFLAQQMGAELVEGSDLVVGDDDCGYMRTIDADARRRDHRRIGDLFLDRSQRDRSQLGVRLARGAGAPSRSRTRPGAGSPTTRSLTPSYRRSSGTTSQSSRSPPNVPTHVCLGDDERGGSSASGRLVVKPANESGGYGMLIGPTASAREREDFRERIKADPRNYIAQPLIRLSTVPTIVDDHVEPRHVDLRPFILQGEHMYVTAGGLTRVALRRGSTVVNSSQGGGSKDTWVVEGML
jgi:uncharacterized circularly permuted ATP-grasp superfamily protein